MYRETIRVLVPGAGLGRLAYDVAKLGGSLSYVPIHVHITHTYKGFACQANEFSHYMLLASFLILNKYG